MNYLSPSEYQLYGLEATTAPALVGAASSLIDAHCRRASLAITLISAFHYIWHARRIIDAPTQGV